MMIITEEMNKYENIKICNYWDFWMMRIASKLSTEEREHMLHQNDMIIIIIYKKFKFYELRKGVYTPTEFDGNNIDKKDIDEYDENNQYENSETDLQELCQDVTMLNMNDINMYNIHNNNINDDSSFDACCC